MKRIALWTALLLALSLLCGCSNVDLSRITSYITGQEAEDPIESPSPAEDQPEETPPQEMAANTVLEQLERPDVLRLAYQADYGLNPYTTVSLCNRTIFSLLYEPLYVVTGQFQAEPVLAAETTVSEDGLITTIVLQRGVRFHNGALLTAQDVVYSYQQARSCDYYGNRFYHITGFSAQDAQTLTVTTDTAYESVALLLDFPIIRDGSVEEAVPDGTGPFRWVNSLKLEAFESWWQSQWVLGYDQVELVSCGVSTDIRDRFEYSQIHLVCTDPNAAAYSTYHTDPELWSCATTIMQYIGFNLDSDVFSNAALRSALTYAIDRDAIVAQCLGGFAVPASLPASPLSPYYNNGLAADYRYDPDTFQSILEEAEIRDYDGDGTLDVYYKGYAIPVEGTMIVNVSNSQRVQAANHIADSLNALGFRITVSALEDSAFQSALKYGNFDLYYGEVRLSANFDLSPFFRTGGSLCFGSLDNGTTLHLCDAMLENSGNAYDLHKRIMEQGYLCPLLFKSYAVYTTRGAASNLDPAVDWVIH